MKEEFDKEFLKILACPSCKKDLKLSKNKLACIKCGKTYPIKNGVPLLLPSS